MSTPKPLEEIEILKKELASKEADLSKVSAELVSKDARISKLEQELLWFRRKVFGKQSEKFIAAQKSSKQLSLFGEELSEQEKAKIEKDAQENKEFISRTIKVSKPRTVRKDPSWDKLRVEKTVIEVGSAVKNDERYKLIGVETSDRLAFTPGELFIKRTSREKYALKKEFADDNFGENKLPAIITAPLKENALYKSLADSSLVSEIVLQKYLYHMPFHRQIQHFRNLGANLSASTIGDWFASACELLKPIYDRLKQDVLSSNYVQVDESSIPVLEKEKQKTKKGYIWVVNDPISKNVFFHYDKGSRSGATAAMLLKDFNGAIQCDGYKAYEQFDNTKGKFILSCWAHARRKFEQSLADDKQLAAEGLVQIQALYSIETSIREGNLNFEQAKIKRQKEAVPILDTFEKWLLDTHPKIHSNSLIGNAIEYTYGLYPGLRRYILEGQYCMDNNRVENAIRPLALGRKNYMFCGNDAAAVRAAIIYSLIGSCKALDINPHEYLSFVLDNINSCKDIALLLPAAFKK